MLNFTNAAELLENDLPLPSWIIPEWVPDPGPEKSPVNGVVVGDAKSGKTEHSLRLAFSLATGVKFHRFERVNPQVGHPVLYVLEENTQTHLKRLVNAFVEQTQLGVEEELEWVDGTTASAINFFHPEFKKLVGKLHLLHLQGTSLLDDGHRAEIVEYCQEHGVIFTFYDPLYLLAPGLDFNLPGHVSRLLYLVNGMSQETGSSPVLVTHKSGGGRIMGSRFFDAWWHWKLDFKRNRDGEGPITTVKRQHKEMGEYDPVQFSKDEKGKWQSQVVEPGTGKGQRGSTERRQERVLDLLVQNYADWNVSDTSNSKLAVLLTEHRDWNVTQDRLRKDVGEVIDQVHTIYSMQQEGAEDDG